MGLAYFRIAPDQLEALNPLIMRHEGELVGPRARGYWFDRPEEYDYVGVQHVAQQLFEAGSAHAHDYLELSENEAHSLSMLELELPSDGLELSPALFMSSVMPAALQRQLKIARRKLGASPEGAIKRISVPDRDPRYTGYLQKQVRHLSDALPKVWHFYEAAAEAGDAVLVVDLRARDLEIPEAVELAAN
jgi:hypothetical protein